MIKKAILLTTFCLGLMSLFCQIEATTTSGEKVMLLSNGTWEYAKEHQPASNFIFVGDKRCLAGQAEEVHCDNRFRTSISIAKNERDVIIVFWQNTSDDQMNFFNWLWEGDVILYLENGEAIRLIDRGMSGQNILDESDVEHGERYQRFAAFYLTKSECELLKANALDSFSYSTSNLFESGTSYITVKQKQWTLQHQIQALGL